MGSVRSKVEKLEERTGARACPACSTDGPYEVELCWSDNATTPTGPEYCSGCGRPLVFTVTWGEHDEPQTAA